MLVCIYITQICVLSSKPAWLDPNKHHFLHKTDQILFALQTYPDATLLEDAATFKSEFREEDHREGVDAWMVLPWVFQSLKTYKRILSYEELLLLSLDITYDQWGPLIQVCRNVRLPYPEDPAMFSHPLGAAFHVKRIWFQPEAEEMDGFIWRVLNHPNQWQVIHV